MTKPTSAAEFSREPAQSVTPDPIHPLVRQYEVIDTDFHFLPDWEDIRKYMPEPFKSEFHRFPPNNSDFSADLSNDKPGTGQTAMGVAKTAEDVLRVIDEIGVDTVVISPGLQKPQGVFNEPTVTALSIGYNRYLQEEVLPASDRLKGEIMVNQRCPEDAADVIRRFGQDERFISVYTEFGGSYESTGSVKHDPIYQAVVDLDLGITLHAGTFWPTGSPLANGSRTWTELFGIAPMSISMAYMASIIFQGLFDKFEGLQVLVKEGGYWWLPDFMARCDDFYLSNPGDIKFTERKLASREKFLKKLPSEYILENFRFSTQPICIPPGKDTFAKLLNAIHAEDVFCYSSDWPHQTFDPANWVFESGPVISEEGRKKILSQNAKDLFKRL